MNNLREFDLRVCDVCCGTGKGVYDYHGNPTYIAKHYSSENYTVFVDKAYDPAKCSICNGFAYTKKGGYAYKSEATCKRMIANGTAAKCVHCDANGMRWKIPAEQSCFDCRGAGYVMEYDSESEIIPDVIDLYGHIKKSFRDGWVNDVEIVVIRNGGSLTWGESYLGLGSIWTCTDYGALFAMTDAEVIRSIRDQLADQGYQLISICDKKTRTLSRTVIVKLTNNGYSLIAAGKEVDGHFLPPAYYDIIDLPVDVANNIIND